MNFLDTESEFTPVYGEEKVIIIGNDFCVIDIDLLIIFINIGLSTIKFDENKKITNETYQDLLDK